MVDSKSRNTTLKKLARWSPSPSTDRKTATAPPLSSDAPFTHVHHDKLQQGSLYIIKIKQVSLAMFEGWNDDMCCFSVLRSEVEPLRWSEARQLPGDFDIYDAFDECGNPPIHLWSRYLKVSVPSNWFSMFEEAKRKQREWFTRQQQQQQGYVRHSLIQHQQQQDQNEYYYPPPSQHTQQLQDGSVIHNNSMPAYSNTDVSTMSLDHQNPTEESVVAPSVVASTNIIDPSLMNDVMTSQSTGLHHQPSLISTTSYTTNSTTRLSRSQVLSPTPSHRENIQQQHSPAERSNSIMDREQIRRHLAPGQAAISSRNSMSVVTLDSGSTALSPLNKESPKLVHHRSKEYVAQSIPEEKIEDKMNVINLESNISSYSNDLEFPHDSDRFSIRSDIPSNNDIVKSPNMTPSISTKSRNRPSMKKILWS